MRLRLQAGVTDMPQPRSRSGGSRPGFPAAPDAPLAVPRAAVLEPPREAPIPPRRLAALPSHSRRRAAARGARKIVRSGVIRARGRGAEGHISTERGDVWRSWRWVKFVVSAWPSSAAVRVRRGEPFRAAARGPRYGLGVWAEGKGSSSR